MVKQDVYCWADILASSPEALGNPGHKVVKARDYDALEADAARYRWLRANDTHRNDYPEDYFAPSSGYLVDCYDMEELDRHIDELMIRWPLAPPTGEG